MGIDKVTQAQWHLAGACEYCGNKNDVFLRGASVVTGTQSSIPSSRDLPTFLNRNNIIFKRNVCVGCISCARAGRGFRTAIEALRWMKVIEENE